MPFPLIYTVHKNQFRTKYLAFISKANEIKFMSSIVHGYLKLDIKTQWLITCESKIDFCMISVKCYKTKSCFINYIIKIFFL